MARTYTIQDMVALPKLSSSDAVVLATQLGTAFVELERLATQSAPLPQNLQRAFARMEAARETLEAALAPIPYNSQAARAADGALDDAWGACSDWLTGWARLPLSRQPLANEIAELHRTLFGDGLRFLLLAYRNQWQESKSRLEILNQEPNRAILARLGGEAFLSHLLEAQSAYGEALGITTPVLVTPPEIREYLAALQLALKDYVLKVQATIEPDDSSTAERAETLLNPLLTWKSRYSGTSSRSTTPESAKSMPVDVA